MRKDEFPIVDKIRKDDMEYLMQRFEGLVQSPIMTDEIAAGITLCYGIVKAYQKRIGEESK